MGFFVFLCVCVCVFFVCLFVTDNYIACFLLAQVIHTIFDVYMYTLLKPAGIYKATGPGHGIDLHRLVCMSKTPDPRICHQIICTTPNYTPLRNTLSSLS